MILNMYLHLLHFKKINEVLASDRQFHALESDNMAIFNYNLVSMPFFRSLGIKSMTELKKAAIATGQTVLIDHDFCYSELYSEGKLCDLQRVFSHDRALIYTFDKKVNSVSEAAIRYQRRFLEEEYTNEYFRYMIDDDDDTDNDDEPYDSSLTKAVDRTIKFNEPKGAGSHLIIETKDDGLHLTVIDNSKKVIDQKNFALSDMPEFEKEYENIEF